jgi:L-lysine 2,3-aminomutase
LRTTIAEGQALMRALHGRFSGLCQPTYVLDIPGGYGKSPIGPSYVSSGGRVEDFNGRLHCYPPRWPLREADKQAKRAAKRASTAAQHRRASKGSSGR